MTKHMIPAAPAPFWKCTWSSDCSCSVLSRLTRVTSAATSARSRRTMGQNLPGRDYGPASTQAARDEMVRVRRALHVPAPVTMMRCTAPTSTQAGLHQRPSPRRSARCAAAACLRVLWLQRISVPARPGDDLRGYVLGQREPFLERVVKLVRPQIPVHVPQACRA